MDGGRNDNHINPGETVRYRFGVNSEEMSPVLRDPGVPGGDTGRFWNVIAAPEFGGKREILNKTLIYRGINVPRPPFVPGGQLGAG